MEISPKEVESVKVIGTLFGEDVKMIKTFGGFNIAVGKDKKNKKKSEALCAGSHQALVAHQLCKDYGSDFQPIICKSEHERMEEVENKTSYLPSEDIAKGIELFTLTKGGVCEFILYKQGITLGMYKAEAEEGSLIIKSKDFSNMKQASRKTAEAMSKAMTDKMYEMNLKNIEKGFF